MTAVLVIGGVIVLAMAGVSLYGWITLPADARVPIHFGTGYNNFVAKGFGLLVHPAAAALVYVIFVVATHPAAKKPPVFVIPIIMCVLLVVQVGAIRVARTRSGM
jgi:hypothetical protein